MNVRGTARGKSIELEEALPFPLGQEVNVSVEPVRNGTRYGSAARLLEAVQRPPHVSNEDVAELERAIESGKLPGQRRGIFDDSTDAE